MAAKFDACNISFSKAIGDVVAAAGTSGNKLTDDERDGYINRALNKLFTEYWTAVKGRTEAFIDIFPELLRDVPITTTAGGIFVLAASGTYDFFKLHSAYKSTQIIKCLDKTLKAIVVTSNNELYTPSTSNFIAIEIEGTIAFYPAASFNAQAVNIQYVRRPIDITGAAFTNGGTYDHPFNANWNDTIVSIALELFKQDTQEIG